MSILPKWLSDRFLGRAHGHALEPTSAVPVKPDMTGTVNSIRNWMGKVIDGIPAEYVRYEQGNKAQKSIHVFITSFGPQFRNMDQNNWATLLPEFHDLHEICRESNVRLEMTGFDALPRAGFASQTSISKNPYAAEISVTFGEPYQYLCNPYSEGQIERALKKVPQNPVPERLRAQQPRHTL